MIHKMLNNTLRILGFIVLAIAFKHWWIVFFALLFMVGANDE